MSSGLSVGEQLAGMLNMLRFGDPKWTSPTGEVSLMSLVWPLLPLLPPQPPPLLTELMRDGDRTDCTTKEKGCMCGKPGKNFVSRSCENTPSPNAAYSSGIELRQRSILPKRHSLDRMVDAIEHKVEEKLNSLEQMTVRNNELDRKKRELYESGNSMSDAELLNRLQSLVKKKQTHEQRLKELETKKQKMEDSLITAITLTKGIEPEGQNKLVYDHTQHKPMFGSKASKVAINVRKHDEPMFGTRKLSEIYNNVENIINAEIKHYNDGKSFQERYITEDSIDEESITERSVNVRLVQGVIKNRHEIFKQLTSIKDKSKEIATDIFKEVAVKQADDTINQLKSIAKNKIEEIAEGFGQETGEMDGDTLTDQINSLEDFTRRFK